MSKNQPQKQPNSGFIDPMEMQNYYQCAYCRTHFLPKKRFVQKYCSESCRVISALAPLLDEPVRKSLGRLFQGNKTPQDVNQFLAQLAPTIKTLPEELQVMVLNSAKGYWDDSMGKNDAGQEKRVAGLPDLKDAL